MTEAQQQDPQVVDQSGAPVQGTPSQEYWGVDETHKHYLPDGIQYFEFVIMNEGAKVRFQRQTNQDMVVGRDQTARVKVSPESERHELIKLSVTDWHFFKDGSPLLFSKQMLGKWLDVAPPKIVEELEYAIRMANPWMQSEMSIEEIDKEIERLYEVRKQVKEREQGEASSLTK